MRNTAYHGSSMAISAAISLGFQVGHLQWKKTAHCFLLQVPAAEERQDLGMMKYITLQKVTWPETHAPC